VDTWYLLLPDPEPGAWAAATVRVAGGARGTGTAIITCFCVLMGTKAT